MQIYFVLIFVENRGLVREVERLLHGALGRCEGGRFAGRYCGLG